MTKMMNELVQYSMSCTNDLMHTLLCLHFLPELIAKACVYLACQFAKVEAINGDWKNILGDPGVDPLASTTAATTTTGAALHNEITGRGPPCVYPMCFFYLTHVL
jgi:hypothetical protein